MARKIFQDFAHVLCQRFVELPSNKDLLNLIILGNGKVELDILAGSAKCNGYAIEPFPYSSIAKEWLSQQLDKHEISHAELTRAILIIEFSATLTKKAHLPAGLFEVKCSSLISAPDRDYSSSMTASKEWGLLTIS